MLIDVNYYTLLYYYIANEGCMSESDYLNQFFMHVKVDIENIFETFKMM